MKELLKNEVVTSVQLKEEFGDQWKQMIKELELNGWCFERTKIGRLEIIKMIVAGK